ncbi:MAG TPA: tetratricopeptide repeat protein [Sandaracinaceae bacterium LLY-WYZ-13_1]|nr:tetratricopeptide repeat protein [Sandaracinaceae bacterium LLY-WYZ-13_1]
MRRWIGWLVAGLLLVSARPGFAQDGMSEEDRRARTHFEAGRLHYEDGAYDRALEEFRRAWELSHRAPLLINLATVEERLAMYSEAADHLREYLRMTPDAPDRSRLENRIENLERLERERGDGAAPPDVEETEDVEADGAETDVDSDADAVGSTEAVPPPATGGPDGGLLAGAIASYGVAAAGGLLMGIFGGMALGEDAALSDGCGATASCTDDEVADANTFALVSDVGLGVLVAGAAAGTVLLILGLASGGEERDVAAAPWLGPDGAGLAAQGRF